MPEFTNPLIWIVPERKMTDAELLRALRRLGIVSGRRLTKRWSRLPRVS
jgi:hypothetical protein